MVKLRLASSGAPTQVARACQGSFALTEASLRTVKCKVQYLFIEPVNSVETVVFKETLTRIEAEAREQGIVVTENIEVRFL